MFLPKLIIFATLAATPAGFFTGNDLWNHCRGDAIDRSACYGYIAGIADATEFEVPRLICMPAHVLMPQLHDVVIAYLEAHPETRHHAAADLVGVALLRAFPCN